MANDKEVFEILLKMKADLAEIKAAQTQVKSFQNEFNGMQSSISKSLSMLSKGFGAFGISLGAIFSAQGAVSYIRSAVAEMAQLGREARQLGVSASGLYELQRAAQRAGVGMGDVYGALTQIRIKADAAAGGNEAAKKSFDALGISVLGTNGNLKNTTALLDEITQKVKSGADLSALGGLVGGERAGKFASIAYNMAGRNPTIDRIARDAEEAQRFFEDWANAIRDGFNIAVGEAVHLAKGGDKITAEDEKYAAGHVARIREREAYYAEQMRAVGGVGGGGYALSSIAKKRDEEISRRIKDMKAATEYAKEQERQEQERIARRQANEKAVLEIDRQIALEKEKTLEPEIQLERLAARRDDAEKSLAATSKDSLEYATRYKAYQEAVLAYDKLEASIKEKQAEEEKRKTDEKRKQAILEARERDGQEKIAMEIALTKAKIEGNQELVNRLEDYQKIKAAQREILSLQNLENLSEGERKVAEDAALSSARERVALARQLLNVEKEREQQARREKQAKDDLFQIEINLAKASGNTKRVEALEIEQAAQRRFESGGYATLEEARNVEIKLRQSQKMADEAETARASYTSGGGTNVSSSIGGGTGGRRSSSILSGTSSRTMGASGRRNIAPSRKEGETWAQANARYAAASSASAGYHAQWNALDPTTRMKLNKEDVFSGKVKLNTPARITGEARAGYRDQWNAMSVSQRAKYGNIEKFMSEVSKNQNDFSVSTKDAAAVGNEIEAKAKKRAGSAGGAKSPTQNSNPNRQNIPVKEGEDPQAEQAPQGDVPAILNSILKSMQNYFSNRNYFGNI